MTREHAKAVAAVLKALSHPSRLLAVEALAGGVKHSVDLAMLANVGQSTMSRHLSMLSRAGLLVVQREGQRVVYGLGKASILKCLECATCVLKADALRMTKALKGV